MREKGAIQISLTVAIILTMLIIGLIGATVYFAVFYEKDEKNVETKVEEQKEDKEEEDDKEIYETPSEEELERAKELEKQLKESLPRMDGSTSTIPLEGGIIASLFDIEQEEAESQITHSTTYGSFNNLMEDKCDIIFSTPLSQEQYNVAKEKNIQLEVVPIVYEGFVFVVNASNPVDSLTQQQIKDIYSGKITNWKEVGGNDAEIVAYQRNATSGSQNYMIDFMKGSELMEPKTDFMPTSMSGLMDAVATYDNAKNAIGYSVYAYAADMYGNGNEIKFIKVDGIEPTKATMATKKYPLLNYNYAIYNKAKEDSTTVNELCEWLLNYNGQVAMSKAGYIPIRKIKATEETIKKYNKTGTGVEIPDDYEMDFVRYELNSSYILKDNKIVGLKDTELQKTINEFIADSISKLEDKEEEFGKYVNLLNRIEEKETTDTEAAIEENEEASNSIYANNGIVVEVECINGYLSIQVYLQYMLEVQAGTPYIYDGYSTIFDLYTGEQLELSDLYFKDVEFISNINKDIKYFENHTPDLTPERTFKRNFAGVPEDIKMYSLTTIGFTKFNPCFAEGEMFNVANYNNSINKAIYMERNMKEIWNSSVKGKIEKVINEFEFTGEKSQKKKENVTYNIYTIDSGNSSVDSKINSYIQNYIVTKITPERINKYISNRDENFSSNQEVDINIHGKIYSNTMAQIDIIIEGTPYIYETMFFDLEEGNLQKITYEKLMEQNEIETKTKTEEE